MFWDAIRSGLNTLAYWEVYACGLQYLLLLWLPMILLYPVLFASDRGAAIFVSVYTFLGPIFITPIFQGFATFVFVITIAPIALGLADDAAWYLPWNVVLQEPASLIKMCGILAVVVLATSFVPFLGQSPFVVSINACIVLYLFLKSSEDGSSFQETFGLILVPNLWFISGFIVVGFVSFLLGTILMAVLSQFLTSVVALPIGLSFGFVPFFFYSAWIGQQIGS